MRYAPDQLTVSEPNRNSSSGPYATCLAGSSHWALFRFSHRVAQDVRKHVAAVRSDLAERLVIPSPSCVSHNRQKTGSGLDLQSSGQIDHRHFSAAIQGCSSRAEDFESIDRRWPGLKRPRVLKEGRALLDVSIRNRRGRFLDATITLHQAFAARDAVPDAVFKLVGAHQREIGRPSYVKVEIGMAGTSLPPFNPECSRRISIGRIDSRVSRPAKQQV